MMTRLSWRRSRSAAAGSKIEGMDHSANVYEIVDQKEMSMNINHCGTFRYLIPCISLKVSSPMLAIDPFETPKRPCCANAYPVSTFRGLSIKPPLDIRRKVVGSPSLVSCKRNTLYIVIFAVIVVLIFDRILLVRDQGRDLLDSILRCVLLCRRENRTSRLRGSAVC